MAGHNDSRNQEPERELPEALRENTDDLLLTGFQSGKPDALSPKAFLELLCLRVEHESP